MRFSIIQSFSALTAACSIAACGSTGSGAAPDASVGADATADATADAGGSSDSAADTGAPTPCGDASASPTQSYALASWPAFPAATGPDMTSSAHLSTTSVNGSPAGIVVTRDGGWVLSAVRPAGLVALRRQGTSLTVDHTIPPPTGQTPFSLAQSHDGTKLAMSTSSAVVLYDLAKAEANAPDAMLATVPDHSSGTTIDVAFSKDDAFVFAALEYDSSVAVIDVNKQSFVGTIPIAGNAVTSVALSPDGSRLYVTCEVSAEFAKANPTFANDQVVGSVTVIDAAKATTDPSGSVLGRVFVGRAPVRAVVSPDGATLWVTARGSFTLVALDTAKLLGGACDPLLSVTPVGPAPVGLAVVGGGKALAVANSNRFAQPNTDQTVMIVDAARARMAAPGAIVEQVTVGAFPREIDDDAQGLFVTNADSKTITGLTVTAE